MKTLVSSLALFPFLSAAVSGAPALENDRVAVRFDNQPGTLWSVTLPGSEVERAVGPPVFEVDGRSLAGAFEARESEPARALASGVVEHVVSGPLATDPVLEMRLVVRLAPGSPIVRFRYELGASEPRSLTKSGGGDALVHLSSQLIWGDLPAVSEEGVARIGRTLDACKQVRDDMARAFPVRSGAIPEIHEKIDPDTGRGGTVVFYSYKSPSHRDDSPSFPGRFTYVTEAVPSRTVWHNEGLRVTFDEAGRAVIEAEFDRPGARIVFFGAEKEAP